MKITIASGKGGTGKTTVAVALSKISQMMYNTAYLDCDVEEPNGFLFFDFKQMHSTQVTVSTPSIKLTSASCKECKECVDFCEFNAIAKVKENVMFFNELCHSCKGCALVCPNKKIEFINSPVGVINSTKQDSQNGNTIYFVEGKLDVGKPMAPPLIKEVKKFIINDYVNIIDSPPGTSCSMISAVEDSDYIILVCEPTPFGLNDLKLAVETVKLLSIPFGVIINKAGENDFETVEYCKNENIDIIAKIPDSLEIAQNYSKGEIELSKIAIIKDSLQKALLKIVNGINQGGKR